jgi:catechol 2,3-dioxygenase
MWNVAEKEIQMSEKTTVQAQPGTGAAPSLPAATGVGAVHLAVTDGAQALEFYEHAVGLTPLTVEKDEIRLGAGGRVLVVLHPGASRPVAPHHTGLYHLALLVPNQRELARAIGRLGTLRIPNSPTDHTMTKSDYLWDLDGNGIEIYAESPEDGTLVYENGTFGARDRDGRRRSGRDPIDLHQLFSLLEEGDRLETPMPDETRMGHVHLHVRNVDEAVDFYHGIIGFDVMGLASTLGVAFISAGGYHHHLGLNTWAGEGAPPPPTGTAGLRHFTIEVPTSDDLSAVAGRLRNAGVDVAENAGGRFSQDPSGNRIQLSLRAG